MVCNLTLKTESSGERAGIDGARDFREMMTEIERGLKLDCGCAKPWTRKQKPYIHWNEAASRHLTTTLPAHVYANYRREARVRANKACATNTPSGKLYSKQ